MTPHRQKGVALVVVLWGLVLIAIIGAGIASGTRTEATLARNAADNARARALADAGMYRAVLGMIDRRAEQRWRADGTEYELVLGGDRARITVHDEFGKIDLNAAHDAAIRLLLVGLGVGDREADALVDAIADYRDADDLRRLNGAEDGDYRAAGLDYGAKDARFEAVDELRRVLGMTPALYRELAPLVTVYSGRRGINPVTAPKELLLAIPGVDTQRIEAFAADRNADSPGPGAAILQAIPKLAALRFTSITSYATVATIRSVARLENGATFIREAVVRVTSRADSPYLILAWRQGRRRPAIESASPTDP